MDTYLQIADEIKKSVSDILGRALAGYKDDFKYKPPGGRKYIRWGLVEKEINAAIEHHLTASKQPDTPEITEPDRLLIALAENLKCIHRDMGGNHKYMVTLKTQPVLRDIKAYVRRRTNGPITDPQKPCEWCKIIDADHQNYCAWCGRRLNVTVNLYPSE